MSKMSPGPKEKQLTDIKSILLREFDVDFYRDRYPDIRESKIDPLEHYVAIGWREGRDPSASFSTSYYLDANPDVRAADINPLYHYVMFGRKEGRPPLRPPPGENSIVDTFATASFSSSDLSRFESLTASNIDYCLCFTPRSGSSWMADLLSKTGVLGDPREWLNPNLLPGWLRAVPQCDLGGYFDHIRRRYKSDNGVFGLRSTAYQLYLVNEVIDLERLFPRGMTFIHLVREDFVLQAISLYRAVETGFFHAPQNLTERQREHLSALAYDSPKIVEWAEHILEQETLSERLYRRLNKTPLRLTYEEAVATPSLHLNLIARFVGLGQFQTAALQQTRYEKIGDRRNAEWARRFREENRDFVDYWTRNRGRVTATQARRTLATSDTKSHG